MSEREPKIFIFYFGWPSFEFKQRLSKYFMTLAVKVLPEEDGHTLMHYVMDYYEHVKLSRQKKAEDEDN